MSVSLDTKGAIEFQSSGTGLNSYKLKLNCPSAISADHEIKMHDPGSNTYLRFGTLLFEHIGDEDKTLLAEDSGTTYFVPSLGAGRTINLPALQAGLEYNFIATGTMGNALTIKASAANLMAGNVIVSAGAAAAQALVSVAGAKQSLQMTATAVVGDHAKVVCDGTRWYASGQSSAAAGLAFS